MDLDCYFPLENLPYPAMWRVFEYLDVLTLRETRTASRTLKMFSDADRLWRRHALPLIQREFSTNPPTRGFRSIFYQKMKLWSFTTLTSGMFLKNNVLESDPSLLNWGTGIVDYPRIRNKRQYCEFLIEDIRDGYLEDTHQFVLGLVPENFEVAVGHCIGEGQSFGYIAISGNKIGGGGAEPMAYGASFKSGDRVGVLADPMANEITFYKNGESQGVAFSNFMDTNVRSYQFAVSMARSHMRVSVLPHASLPSAPYPQPRKEIAVSSLPLNRFPSDLVLGVFGKLPVSDINSNRLVCKAWNRLASSNYVWGAALRKMAFEEDPLADYRLTTMRNTHRFSTTTQAPGLELSNDRTTVTSSSLVTYWSAIRLDYPKMTSGVHYAEFRIDLFRHGPIGNTWKLCIGVVSEEFDYSLTKWVGVDEKSFGFIAANGKAVGPFCKNLGSTYADGYQENDRIGVLVDFYADQILFYKNGVNLGVAFDGFSKQVNLNNPKENHYYFACSLARWGMALTVLPGAKCPDRDIPIG